MTLSFTVLEAAVWIYRC